MSAPSLAIWTIPIRKFVDSSLRQFAKRVRIRAVARCLAVAVLTLACASPAFAHDIPNDVVVQTFLRPQGRTLHLLIRVPMDALRDVDVPQRREGYVDLSRIDQTLRDATVVWIARELELYEGDTRL